MPLAELRLHGLTSGAVIVVEYLRVFEKLTLLLKALEIPNRHKMVFAAVFLGRPLTQLEEATPRGTIYLSGLVVLFAAASSKLWV